MRRALHSASEKAISPRVTKQLCSTQFSVYHNAMDNYLQHSEIGDKYAESQHIVEDDADVVKLYIRKARESFRTRTIESIVLYS